MGFGQETANSRFEVVLKDILMCELDILLVNIYFNIGTSTVDVLS